MTRRRFFSRQTHSLLLGATTLALFACRGNPKPPSGPAGAAAADASAQASSSTVATTLAPNHLPPMAIMPSPFVRGSKKATIKHEDALFACTAGMQPSVKDPAFLVKRVGEACASTTHMHPVSEVFRGQQADKEPAHEHKVRVEEGKCYRVYFATDESLRDAVVVLRDSAGDTIAEASGPALPEDGSVCFLATDEVTVFFGVGAGKGGYAAQLWGQ